jgi:MYXO-CTERM domain-containing protein
MCIGMNRVMNATYGTKAAIQLQNEEASHRLYQNVTLPADAQTLKWDMSYDNQALADSINQRLNINIRDTGDNILATLFTTEGKPFQQLGMTAHEADISAYAGMTVRLDFTHVVVQECFPLVLDHLRIDSDCGDTLVEGVEECDDGPAGSDTCTDACTIIAPMADEDGGCSTGGSGGGFALLVLLALRLRRRRQ